MVRHMFTCVPYLWYQADMDVAEVFPLHLELELPEGLNKRHALNVPDCASQLLVQSSSLDHRQTYTHWFLSTFQNTDTDLESTECNHLYRGCNTDRTGFYFCNKDGCRQGKFFGKHFSTKRPKKCFILDTLHKNPWTCFLLILENRCGFMIYGLVCGL